MQITCRWIVVAALAFFGAFLPPADAQVPNPAFEKRSVTDKLGRRVTYYASKPSKPAPLLLMIQGSGCTSVLASQSGGSTIFNLGPFANEQRFTVIAVEKPHAERRTQDGGIAQGCSKEFNESFTATSWLEALRASVAHARKSASVDQRRTLVMGFSEGAVMASLLAARDPKITDVVSVGGSGTTQLFDFLVGAYDCFDASACVAQVEAQAKAISAKPQSATEFAWGHPFKRWSSFFRVDPAQELLRSKARVYLAFGTRDESVPPPSQELLAAKLMSEGRDVTVRRVADAGHSLLLRNTSDWSGLDRELRTALDWFWGFPAAGN